MASVAIFSDFGAQENSLSLGIQYPVINHTRKKCINKDVEIPVLKVSDCTVSLNKA